MRGADLSGQLIDRRYQVIERIAEGAMGVVYRAVRLKLDRAVAIKVMHASIPGDTDAHKRFEREAQLMARLEHPHCVSIIDYGLHDSKPYVVMELVRGRSLHDMIAEQGRFEIARAVDIVHQVLSGLAHAHEERIIHRDIKPANIMTTPKAPLGVHVRILDFGLARMLGSSTSLTDGLAVGTPSYMAPEQCRGDEVDARVDIYACGVLLFEMLTGKKPFRAKDPLEIIKKHLTEPPPLLRDVAPGDYGALEGVVARALAKSPADRYRSAIAMAEALQSVVAGNKATDSTTQLPLSSIPAGGAESVEIPITVGSSDHIPVETLSSSALVPDDPEAARPRAPEPSSRHNESSVLRSMLPVSRMRYVAVILLVLVGGAIAAIVMVRRESTQEQTASVEAPRIIDASVPTPIDAAPDPAAEIVGAASQLAAAGKVDKAIAMLLEARPRFPARAEIPAAIGTLYLSKRWWNDGLASLRDALKLDPSLRADRTIVDAVVRGFITTPGYDPRLGQFLVELGPAAVPYLEDVARTHRNPQIRARAATMQKRLR